MKKKIKYKISFFKKWIENNPKTTFFIMIALTISSIALTAINYSIRANKQSTINTSFKGVLNEAKNNVQENLDYLEFQTYREELQRFAEKEHLTKGDSLRIEYLINKLNSDE